MQTDHKNELLDVAKNENQWRKALIILAVILAVVLLIGWNVKLSAELKNMRNQQMDLQSQLSGVSNSISGSFSSFSEEVKKMLEAQDSIIADFSVEELSRDLKAGTVQYSISATPKTYKQGMTVSFVANDGNDSTVVQGEETNLSYTANLACGFTDNITITVLLKYGDTTQTQVLLKGEGWYSETLLTADEDFYSFLLGIDPQKPYYTEPAYEAFIGFRDYQGMEPENLSAVKRVDYYVLVNDIIVATAVGKPGSQTWYGEEDQVMLGYKVNVPMKFLKSLKAADKLVLAVMITDNYGRRYCTSSTGLVVKKIDQSLVIEMDERFVYDRAFEPLK